MLDLIQSVTESARALEIVSREVCASWQPHCVMSADKRGGWTNRRTGINTSVSETKVTPWKSLKDCDYCRRDTLALVDRRGGRVAGTKGCDYCRRDTLALVDRRGGWVAGTKGIDYTSAGRDIAGSGAAWTKTEQGGVPVTRTSYNKTTSNIDCIDGPRTGP